MLSNTIKIRTYTCCTSTLPSNLFFGRPIYFVIYTFNNILKKNYITKINKIQMSKNGISKFQENTNTNVIRSNQEKKKILPQILSVVT